MKSPSQALAQYYLAHDILPAQTVEYMEYALHSILSELVKLITYFLLFLILGKCSHYLFILAVLFPIRWFSGGIHARTFWGCFFASLILLTGLIYLPPILPYPNALLFFLLCILFFLSVPHVPYTPAFRPITSARNIRILRIFYIAVFCTWIAILNLVELPSQYVSSGFYTMLCQVVQLFIFKKGVYQND